MNMSNPRKRYGVMIFDRDEDAENPMILGQDDDLSWALCFAIRIHGGPVPLDQLMADLVMHQAEDFRDGENFPGREELLDALVEAASSISEGWENRHAERDERYRKLAENQ
jgi:hypothetical protein